MGAAGRGERGERAGSDGGAGRGERGGSDGGGKRGKRGGSDGRGKRGKRGGSDGRGKRGGIGRAARRAGAGGASGAGMGWGILGGGGTWAGGWCLFLVSGHHPDLIQLVATSDRVILWSEWAGKAGSNGSRPRESTARVLRHRGRLLADYDPATRTWRSLSAAPRDEPTDTVPVWTGSELVAVTEAGKTVALHR